MPPAGVGDLLHNVAFAVLPRAVLHGVLRVFARPEAEAVVVLAGEDDAAQARVVNRADDLLGVEIGRVEYRFLFVAVAPFTIGERVHREMDEGVALQLVPRQLPRRRDRAVWFGRLGGRKRSAIQREGQDSIEASFHIHGLLILGCRLFCGVFRLIYQFSDIGSRQDHSVCAGGLPAA